MIRISFTKIEFSQNTKAEQTFIQVQTENSLTLKLKPKKVKNLLSRFYGDFVELESNNFNLKLKVYTLEPGNTQALVEKIPLKKNTYGLLQKKSHFVQTFNLKIWFDSQKIDLENSKADDSTNQSASFTTNAILNDRMGLMKILREFSPDQKCTMGSKTTIGVIPKIESKNVTMKICHKSPFKDMMKMRL